MCMRRYSTGRGESARTNKNRRRTNVSESTVLMRYDLVQGQALLNGDCFALRLVDVAVTKEGGSTSSSPVTAEK